MKQTNGWASWLAILGGLAVMVMGIVFVQRIDTDITLAPSPLIGREAPNVSVKYLDSSDTFQLEDYEGEIVVINFWASWCGNCRVEHSALNTAAAAYADAGVSFVGVAYQDRESASLDFLEELGRGEPYTYGIDGGSRVAVEFGILGLPETFFIDASGFVRAKVSGPVSLALVQQTLDAMLLGESVDPQTTTDDVENR
ncbi:MAG: redoxin domain-containing protein [bacterium]|nr:redoxin domain-containing protein [bacterium]